MPFTVQQLETITANTVNYHMNRGELKDQAIQDKPLLKAFEKKEKSFAAGKEEITGNARFSFSATLEGYAGDDQLSFSDTREVKQYRYPIKNTHIGSKITFDELTKNGINVTDGNGGGAKTSENSGREVTALDNMLTTFSTDLVESNEAQKNLMYWRDGTQDSTLVPGIGSFIVTDPTSATVVGGIDQSLNTKWRNRALLNLSTSTPTASTVAQGIQKEMRQLMRYGRPKHMLFAGSDFIDALEKEQRANGYYTQGGWASQGMLDMKVGDIGFNNIKITYEPTLDDESKSKYLYILDMNSIYPMYIEGANDKAMNPTRPHDRLVLYRSIISTRGLVCEQRNTSGIVTIA